MGMAAPVYCTADMVRALPDDGNRYEAVHGELLVTPAPRLWHQAIVSRLIVAFDSFRLSDLASRGRRRATHDPARGAVQGDLATRAACTTPAFPSIVPFADRPIL
jgi:hypothetical protein